MSGVVGGGGDARKKTGPSSAPHTHTHAPLQKNNHTPKISAKYRPRGDAGTGWARGYHTALYNLTDAAVRGERAVLCVRRVCVGGGEHASGAAQQLAFCSRTPAPCPHTLKQRARATPTGCS